jgi:hypothetical protein
MTPTKTSRLGYIIEELMGKKPPRIRAPQITREVVESRQPERLTLSETTVESRPKTPVSGSLATFLPKRF